jgi:ubiquinone/menaquinone biosynthesis C-methylase UbiE
MVSKDWDAHVVEAEELARTPGFQRLRDRILALARPEPEDVAVDVGAGTGLLSLALAAHVKRVWALDISPAMTEYLRVKAASAELENIEATTATAISLPLVDESATLVVSNYCYHHLSDEDKERALSEALRVLVPGGRIVIGDMMFRVEVASPRNRRLIWAKVKAIARRGPAGMLRLLRNALRLAAGRWEKPAEGHWWHDALRRAGFEAVSVELLDHEGGIVVARRPERPVAWRGLRRRRPATAPVR